jgi:tetratricopeptide (TPR) repeat protein
MNKKLSIILLLMFLFISSSVFAETIVLKSGQTQEGKVIEKTDKYVKIQVQNGVVATIPADLIQKIDGVFIHPREPAQVAFDKGLENFKTGKIEKINEAINDFTKAIELNPNYARAYYCRGLIYEGRDYDKAISDFSKVIEINPNDALAYNCRAMMYYSKHEYDKAWQDVHKAEALGYSEYKPRRLNSGFIESLKKASGREE